MAVDLTVRDIHQADTPAVDTQLDTQAAVDILATKDTRQAVDSHQEVDQASAVAQVVSRQEVDQASVVQAQVALQQLPNKPLFKSTCKFY